MSNLLLGVVALVITIGSILRARQFPTALPAACSASIFLLLAFFGHALWTWSRESAGAGLPATIDSVPFGRSVAATCLLWAAIGSAAAAYIVPRRRSIEYTAIAASLRNERTARTLFVVSTALIPLWLVGQGPNVLNRSSYLETNGNDFLLRATTLPGPLLAIFAVIMAARTTDSTLRRLLLANVVVWYILEIAIGTRTAVALPLLGALFILQAAFRGRRVRIGHIALGLAMLMLSVVTVTICLYARTGPHGLLNLGRLIEFGLNPTPGFNRQSEISVKALIASIAASYPIIERSVQVPVGLDVLLSNANPLPGTSLAFMLERYQPYEWVPLAMVGEWYNAVGALGQLALYLFVAYLCGVVTHNLLQSKYYVLSIAGIGLSLMIGVLSVQYSSRIVWRFLWIALAVAVITYLIRQRRETLIQRRVLRPDRVAVRYPSSRGPTGR